MDTTVSGMSFEYIMHLHMMLLAATGKGKAAM
jgi:hypothetical protein